MVGSERTMGRGHTNLVRVLSSSVTANFEDWAIQAPYLRADNIFVRWQLELVSISQQVWDPTGIYVYNVLASRSVSCTTYVRSY